MWFALANGSVDNAPFGIPVRFVPTPLAGVPNAGVINVGLVANANLPLPVSSLISVAN